MTKLYFLFFLGIAFFAAIVSSVAGIIGTGAVNQIVSGF